MSEPYVARPLPPVNPDLDIRENHYWRYHHLDDLLACKQPITVSPDEDLFITVHQVCELAFHQMILDLDRTLDTLAQAFTPNDPGLGDTSEALYFLKRVLRLWEVVLTTMPILGTMHGFAEFRTSIGPTSGFQSFQFRQLEVMSGVQDPYWKGGTQDLQGNLHPAEVEFNRRYGPEVIQWFERYRAHSLAYFYQALLERVTGETVEAKLQLLRQDPQAAPLLKLLAAYDVSQMRFHHAHLGLAVQQLAIVGADMGTGGTSFRSYLSKYGQEVAPLFPGLAEDPAHGLS